MNMILVPLPRPFAAAQTPVQQAPVQQVGARLPLLRARLAGPVREEALRALGQIVAPRITRSHGADADARRADEAETPCDAPLPLTSWRGLSGRRYVVSLRSWPEIEESSRHREMREASLPAGDDLHGADSGADPGADPGAEAALAAIPFGAVLLAVRRRPCGDARLLGVMAREERESHAIAPWFAAMTALGADELHVHLLAGCPAARRAACADLSGHAAGDAAGDPGAAMIRTSPPGGAPGSDGTCTRRVRSCRFPLRGSVRPAGGSGHPRT